jgi:hypothetical protein
MNILKNHIDKSAVTLLHINVDTDNTDIHSVTITQISYRIWRLA